MKTLLHHFFHDLSETNVERTKWSRFGFIVKDRDWPFDLCMVYWTFFFAKNKTKPALSRLLKLAVQVCIEIQLRFTMFCWNLNNDKSTTVWNQYLINGRFESKFVFIFSFFLHLSFAPVLNSTFTQIEYCAKVMRANFVEFRALFSSKYRRTFDRHFAAFTRQLNEISTTIRQGKRKIESKNRKANRKIASSNFQTSEISKKIRFKLNVISANFLTAR